MLNGSESGLPLTGIEMLSAMVERSRWSVVDNCRGCEKVGSMVEIDTDRLWT